MNLIIFDIDGTLTDTFTLDGDYFFRAIREQSKIESVNTDWSVYQYSTDSGILNEIFQTVHQRDPEDKEISLIRDQFAIHIKNAHLENKSVIAPIPGATTIFSKIRALSNWHIGIATGGWKQTALYKLNSAEIPHDDVQKAYADDHIARSEIIKRAVNRCEVAHSVERYHRIVYVGDAEWDLRATKKLGIEFIGVGHKFAERGDVFSVKDLEEERFLERLAS